MRPPSVGTLTLLVLTRLTWTLGDLSQGESVLPLPWAGMKCGDSSSLTLGKATELLQDAAQISKTPVVQPGCHSSWGCASCVPITGVWSPLSYTLGKWFP